MSGKRRNRIHLIKTDTKKPRIIPIVCGGCGKRLYHGIIHDVNQCVEDAR